LSVKRLLPKSTNVHACSAGQYPGAFGRLRTLYDPLHDVRCLHT